MEYKDIDYSKAKKVLEVKDLRVNFKSDSGLVHAVRGVSFDLYKGETLCIVGESGSGKSVSSKAIMGILANNSIVEGGSIIYKGEDLLKVSEEEFHRIRGHKIGMIFQDPLSSLNPIMRIGKQLTETMLINKDMLKRKYNDLISNELVALLNSKVEYEQAVQAVINERNVKVTNISKLSEKKVKDLKEKINEINNKTNLTKGEKAVQIEQLNKEIKAEEDSLKSEIKAIENEYAPKIKETKASAKKIYKDNLPTLKKNLKDRKKSAKKEVKAYANELKARYEQDKINLELKLRDAKTDEEITKVKAELDQLKSNYKNSIKITKKEAKKRALEVMREVGIPQPEKRFRQYPFEFSGGMRQRIVIAIALIADPEILICDEPTTALDVTIQAQILELINKIKAERNLSCIFITHDLGVVANMADRVAVMYAGKIVEYGTAEEIFFDPRHPYTWALLASIPDIDSKEKLDAIPGTPPNMVYPPIGDAFALRSKYALAIDFKYEPPYFKVSDTHYAATWLLHKDAPKAEMPKIVSTRIKKALKEGK